MSGSQTQFQGQWCQPRPWAINSVISSEGWVSKNYGADQQRVQISDLHFDNFFIVVTFACWKVRFKTKVCICSQFLTEAMQWIKEVELFSGWIEIFLISSWYVNAEEHKAQEEDQFLRGRQIAYLIHDYFRVTGTHDFVEKCTDLFTIVLRNDDIEEFDSKWDGILLSFTKIPPDDILEGLYKLRIRESDKLKTVLELYDVETHQKLGPDFHRLRSYGEKKYRAGNSKEEFWEWKFWERRGQESGNTTARTKNSWRLLAMRIQRAVCVRRQLQFHHNMNKRGRSSPSNPSPNTSMQQSERKPSRTHRPGKHSPSV